MASGGSERGRGRWLPSAGPALAPVTVAGLLCAGKFFATHALPRLVACCCRRRCCAVGGGTGTSMGPAPLRCALPARRSPHEFTPRPTRTAGTLASRHWAPCAGEEGVAGSTVTSGVDTDDCRSVPRVPLGRPGVPGPLAFSSVPSSRPLVPRPEEERQRLSLSSRGRGRGSEQPWRSWRESQYDSSSLDTPRLNFYDKISIHFF